MPMACKCPSEIPGMCLVQPFSDPGLRRNSRGVNSVGMQGSWRRPISDGAVPTRRRSDSGSRCPPTHPPGLPPPTPPPVALGLRLEQLLHQQWQPRGFGPPLKMKLSRESSRSCQSLDSETLTQASMTALIVDTATEETDMSSRSQALTSSRSMQSLSSVGVSSQVHSDDDCDVTEAVGPPPLATMRSLKATLLPLSTLYPVGDIAANSKKSSDAGNLEISRDSSDAGNLAMREESRCRGGIDNRMYSTQLANRVSFDDPCFEEHTSWEWVEEQDDLPDSQMKANKRARGYSRTLPVVVPVGDKRPTQALWAPTALDTNDEIRVLPEDLLNTPSIDVGATSGVTARKLCWCRSSCLAKSG